MSSVPQLPQVRPRNGAPWPSIGFTPAHKHVNRDLMSSWYWAEDVPTGDPYSRTISNSIQTTQLFWSLEKLIFRWEQFGLLDFMKNNTPYMRNKNFLFHLFFFINLFSWIKIYLVVKKFNAWKYFIIDNKVRLLLFVSFSLRSR